MMLRSTEWFDLLRYTRINLRYRIRMHGLLVLRGGAENGRYGANGSISSKLVLIYLSYHSVIFTGQRCPV